MGGTWHVLNCSVACNIATQSGLEKEAEKKKEEKRKKEKKRTDLFLQSRETPPRDQLFNGFSDPTTESPPPPSRSSGRALGTAGPRGFSSAPAWAPGPAGRLRVALALAARGSPKSTARDGGGGRAGAANGQAAAAAPARGPAVPRGAASELRFPACPGGLGAARGEGKGAAVGDRRWAPAAEVGLGCCLRSGVAVCARLRGMRLVQGAGRVMLSPAGGGGLGDRGGGRAPRPAAAGGWLHVALRSQLLSRAVGCRRRDEGG